jgi:hypothetical protein
MAGLSKFDQMLRKNYEETVERQQAINKQKHDDYVEYMKEMLNKKGGKKGKGQDEKGEGEIKQGKDVKEPLDEDLLDDLYEAASGVADETAARELELYIENDAQLYRQQTVPIMKNLSKRWKKKQYDKAKAVKLWMYLADAGGKKYVKEYGSRGDKIDSMFNKKTREMVAKSMEDNWSDEMKLGNFVD